MARDQIEQTLRRLHEELSQSPGVSGEAREMLERVMHDIAILLGESASEPHTPHSLGERLREAADQFEETHPRLTFAIGEVADVLSSIGI